MAAKIQCRRLLIIKWKVSPAKYCNCLTKMICLPIPLFHDLNTSAQNQFQSHGNGFDYEQYVSWCFSGEMVAQREKSSMCELVCQNEPLSSQPPLPVIFPQTQREAVCHLPSDIGRSRITGALKCTCQKLGQCSVVTLFVICIWICWMKKKNGKKTRPVFPLISQYLTWPLWGLSEMINVQN